MSKSVWGVDHGEVSKAGLMSSVGNMLKQGQKVGATGVNAGMKAVKTAAPKVAGAAATGAKAVGGAVTAGAKKLSAMPTGAKVGAGAGAVAAGGGLAAGKAYQGNENKRNRLQGTTGPNKYGY